MEHNPELYVSEDTIKSWTVDLIPTKKPYIKIGEGARIHIEGHLCVPPVIKDNTTTLYITLDRFHRNLASNISKVLPPKIENLFKINIDSCVQLVRMHRGVQVLELQFPTNYDRIKNISIESYYCFDIQCLGINTANQIIEWKLRMIRIIETPSIKEREITEYSTDDFDTELDLDPDDVESSIQSMLKLLTENLACINTEIQTSIALTENLQLKAASVKSYIESLEKKPSYINSVKIYDEWLRLGEC